MKTIQEIKSISIKLEKILTSNINNINNSVHQHKIEPRYCKIKKI